MVKHGHNNMIKTCLIMFYGHVKTCFNCVFEHVWTWLNMCVKWHHDPTWSKMIVVKSMFGCKLLWTCSQHILTCSSEYRQTWLNMIITTLSKHVWSCLKRDFWITDRQTDRQTSRQDNHYMPLDDRWCVWGHKYYILYFAVKCINKSK